MTKYRSGLEERIADLFSNLGVIYEYEPIRIAYTLQCQYCPDFVLPNGVHIEAKGLWESADRRKILQVKKEHPDLDLRMVFQSPSNKIYKGSKTTYAAFCEKHNIPWAVSLYPYRMADLTTQEQFKSLFRDLIDDVLEEEPNNEEALLNGLGEALDEALIHYVNVAKKVERIRERVRSALPVPTLQQQ